MNRILEYLQLDPDPETKLSSFLCIYPFQGEEHNVVIYANNWHEAHSYAHYHKLIVKEKLETV